MLNRNFNLCLLLGPFPCFLIYFFPSDCKPEKTKIRSSKTCPQSIEKGKRVLLRMLNFSHHPHCCNVGISWGRPGVMGVRTIFWSWFSSFQIRCNCSLCFFLISWTASMLTHSSYLQTISDATQISKTSKFQKISDLSSSSVSLEKLRLGPLLSNFSHHSIQIMLGWNVLQWRASLRELAAIQVSKGLMK